MGLACIHCGEQLPEEARFCPSCGKNVASKAASATPTEMLKVVTILFADVVGSTARAERMHPEDTRALMTDLFTALTEEVEREGGLVERIIGDGLMADFGMPQAHEDDPLRAVRAARAMLDRLERWNTDKAPEHQIEMRIGINTGDVSAAGAPGEDLLVTGDAVNVAARLEQAAAPGEIVVGDRTARAIRHIFHLQPLAPIAAKGKSEPLTAFSLGSVLDKTESDLLSAPFIGRDEELNALRGAYERCARTRSPHLVTVIGDAGVGKSRLVKEFLEALPENTCVLIGRCISHGEGAALWPLREILGSAAGFVDSDPESVARASIDALVANKIAAESEDRDRFTAALASTVGIRSASLDALDPRARHRELLVAWRSLLGDLADKDPVILVIQDIHWASELMLDILDDLVGHTTGPLMFLCPTRPELYKTRTGWGTGSRDHLTLRLEPLTEEESASLAASMLDIEVLPVGFKTKLLTKCEGNPFFLQEVVRQLVDAGQIGGVAGSQKTDGVTFIEIPDTVQGVLLARIDLLSDSEKAIAQKAAVVGRAFWQGAVARLMAHQDLDPLLYELEQRAFITERSRSTIAGEVEYAFNHILIRDVVYATMPRRLRGAAHEAVADWITEISGERRNEHIEVLARHYEHAYDLLGRDDLRRKARDHLLQASTEALRRFAVRDASELGRRAIALSKGPEECIAALEAFGDGSMTGYCIDDAWAAYSEALEEAKMDPGLASKVAPLAAKAAIAATRFEGAMNVTPKSSEVQELLALGLASGPDDVSRCILLASKAFARSSGEPQPQKKEDPALQALALAERLDDPELISLTLDAGAFWMAPEARYGEMHDLQMRRIALLPRLSSISEACDTYGSACWSSYYVGLYADTVAHATECLRLAEGIDAGNYEHALQWKIMARFRLGDWDGALEDQAELETLVAQGTAAGDTLPAFLSSAYSVAFLCRELRGDAAHSARYLAMLNQLKRSREEAGEPIGGPRGATALALLHRGETQEADAWLNHEALYSGSWLGPNLEALTELTRAKEDWTAADELLHKTRSLATTMRSPSLECYSSRLEGLAVLATGASGLEQAVRLLLASAQGFGGLSVPWEEALSLALAGEVLQSKGQKSRAENHLRTALATFERLGSVAEIARASRALSLL
jgi:class 3 adenylate cyclase